MFSEPPFSKIDQVTNEPFQPLYDDVYRGLLHRIQAQDAYSLRREKFPKLYNQGNGLHAEREPLCKLQTVQ